MEQCIIELILIGVVCGLIGGAIGGTLAGLAGVGGGLIYVPLLYLAMPGNQQGLGLQVLGSLVAVAVTGFFSARAHWKLGHIHITSLKKLYPGLMIGAAIGLWSTLRIPEAWILLLLAGLDLWVGLDMGKNVEFKRNVPLTSISGGIGYISGTLGIGGGTMLVPLLRRAVSLREAVGTSAACGVLMSLGAVTFNILFEPLWHSIVAGQIEFLIGFWMGILMIIPKSSGWAAWFHARMDEIQMRITLKTIFFMLSATLFTAALANLITN